MTELFSENLATASVLSGGTDAPAALTTETWLVSSSAMFGAAVSGVSQFHVADQAAPSETIKVSNVSGDTWTVVRGAEGTVPVQHQPGFAVYQVVTTGFLGSVLTAGQIPATVTPSSALIPMYIYPSPLTSWTTVNGYAPTVKYVVANASSGPGTTVDPNYATAIANAQAAGITVLGYVDTNYGAVPAGTVSTNIGLWESLYGVTSIFFDRAATSTGELSYYTTVCGYVHATAGAVAVLNHGAIPNVGYAALGDILVVFEGAYSSWSSFSPPSWFASYPPSKFAVLVYSASGTATMAGVVTQAQQYGIGNIYVTDEADDNFSALPTYLAAEIAQLAVPLSGYLPTSGGTVTGPLKAAGSLAIGAATTITYGLSPYTASLTSDYMLQVDATAGAVTINLPTGATVGQLYIIKKTDSSANGVTVSGNGNTIDGNTSVVFYNQYSWLKVQWNGNSWDTLAGNVFTTPGANPTGHWYGSIITDDITVQPNATISSSASMFLDNNTGQVWEFFNNDYGYFGVYDKTNSQQPFYITSGSGGAVYFTPLGYVYLNPTGDVVLNGTGSLRVHTGTQFLAGIQYNHGSLTSASSPHTVSTGTENFLGCDPSGGAIVINLPSVNYGACVIIVKDETGHAATHNITINGTSGQTIDGAASVVISANYGVVRLYSNGSNWSQW